MYNTKILALLLLSVKLIHASDDELELLANRSDASDDTVTVDYKEESFSDLEANRSVTPPTSFSSRSHRDRHRATINRRDLTHNIQTGLTQTYSPPFVCPTYIQLPLGQLKKQINNACCIPIYDSLDKPRKYLEKACKCFDEVNKSAICNPCLDAAGEAFDASTKCMIKSETCCAISCYALCCCWCRDISTTSE